MANQYTKRRDEEAAQVEPGTRAAAQEIAETIGMPGLPERYTNEAIDAANAERPESSGVYVIRDTYEGDLAARATLRRQGAQTLSPTDEIAMPYVEANPDRAFRWLTAAHCEKRGTRGYQPVIDPNTGKKVTHLNESRWLGHVPKDVKEARLASYRQQSEQMRTAAREEAVEKGLKAERDTDGAIRMIGQDEMLKRFGHRGR